MADITRGEEWKRYWQGRQGVGEASLLARPAVELDQAFQIFWKSQIGDAPRNARLVDLACGAGSVISHAHSLGFTDLTGVDISEAAITILKSGYPNATGIVASVDELPATETGFDLVVSQFGFEYAGVEKTIPVIARLLAPNGRFIALVHMAGGKIHRDCQRSLEDCLALEATGFIPAAERVFQAQFAKDAATENESAESELESAVSGLAKPRDQLQLLAGVGHQLAAQLLSGTQQLFQRRRNYLPEDITSWLVRVAAENASHKDRMISMMNAALTEAEARSALGQLENLGLRTAPLKPLTLAPQGDEVAWILSAEKPDA